MGKCRENTKKVFREIARVVTPGLMSAAARAVFGVERLAATDPEFWTNAVRRKVALSHIFADARDQGITSLKESEATLALEAAHYATNKLGIPPEDLGHVDDPLVEPDVETPPLPGGGA